MHENALKTLNNGFGPISNIRCKKWKNLAAVGVIFVFYLLLGLHRIITKKIPLRNVYTLHDVVMCCGVLSAAMFGEFVRRLCLYAEEHQHSDTRYMGSKRKAMEACLCWSKLPKETLLMFGIATAVIAYTWVSEDQISGYPLEIYLLTALLGSVGTDLLSVKPPTKAEISDLNESENKHVSDGLAWSYYFGYLKLILPDWDGVFQKAQGKGFQITEEGGEAEDIRDIITDKRLFVFLPRDGYCYTPFNEVDERIKFVQTMPAQHKLRGGVQERIYKNSLYQILTEEGEKVYVMMEYATPLLSMYDMSTEKRAAFSEENLEEQVVEFYTKLKEILENDEECKGKYKLVLTSRGSSGNKPKLVDIILNAIKEKHVEITDD